MKAIIITSSIGLVLVGVFFLRTQQPIISIEPIDETINASNQSPPTPAVETIPPHFSDTLTFSNTQRWNEDIRSLIFSMATTSRLSLLAKIELPVPPKNSSEITRQEIELLHQYVHARNPEVVAAILSENIFTPELGFGPRTLGDFLFTTERVNTRRLFDELFRSFAPIVMSLKDSFDRVRPSHLDSTLTTVIEVPGHPAYPSGHASQAFVMAEFMAALDPVNAEAYFASAAAIAYHREVAGLHYPSDTEAGRRIAKQFFALALKDKLLGDLFISAKEEWLIPSN